MHSHPLIAANKTERTEFETISQSSTIAKLWDGIDNQFCVIGGLTDSYVYRLTLLQLEDKTEIAYHGDDGFQPVDMEKLKAKAKVSAFGRGEETVVDEMVRQSLEIPMADVKSDLNGHQSSIINLIDCSPLVDLLGTTKFKVIPHKLLIYEQGGHFEEHVDSQHSENQVASLLMHLPISEYKGGELVVKHNGKEKTVDFSGSKELKYVAFFTDCPHKVQPITEGSRVVLQFDVVLEKNEQIKRRRIESPSLKLHHRVGSFFNVLGKPLETTGNGEEVPYDQEKMQNLLTAIEEVVTEDKKIAIMLKHRYSVMECEIPELLKGADAALYKRLLEKFAVKPVTFIVETTFYPGDQFNPDDERTEFEMWPCEGVDSSEVDLLVSQNPGLEAFHHQEYVEYTGNEAQPEKNRYLGAAFVISSL